MEGEHLIFLLFGLSAASVAYCWWLWLRSVKFPPPEMRSWAEFIVLIAGTLLVSLPLLAFLPLLARIASRLDLAWVFSAVTLMFSLFGWGKLRIAGILVGSMMCWFWWEVMRLAEGLCSALRGGVVS
jgi:hypothetical protein